MLHMFSSISKRSSDLCFKGQERGKKGIVEKINERVCEDLQKKSKHDGNLKPHRLALIQ